MPAGTRWIKRVGGFYELGSPENMQNQPQSSNADREHTMTNVPDFNSSTEKRARFGKVFSTRVEKLLEALQAMAKTANLEIYEFDDELVKKLFIELAKQFRATAHRFGIEFEISIDREPIE